MDPSRFLRSRPILAGWIAVPLIVIGVVHHGTRWYCESVEARLVRDRAMLEVMPDLLRGLHRGQAELAAYARGAADPARMNDMSLQLGEIAARQGFTLDAARLAPPTRGEADPRLAMIANLEGSGTLLSVLQLLDALQGPRELVSVESAVIRLLPTEMPPRYQARCVLHYYRLDAAAAEAETAR